jgi:hypothetical protein
MAKKTNSKMVKLFIQLGFENDDKQILYGCDFSYVSRIYSRFIKDIDIKSLRKIVISIIDTPQETHIMPLFKALQICDMSIYINVDYILNEENETLRMKSILEFMHSCVMELVKKFSWPPEDFIEAYNKVLSTEFKNNFTLIAPKSSKDRRLQVSVLVCGTPLEQRVYLEIKHKKENFEFKLVELITLKNYVYYYWDIIDKIKWLDNDTIIISNFADEIHFSYNLLNEKLKFYLTPQKHSMDYFINKIDFLTGRKAVVENNEILLC